MEDVIKKAIEGGWEPKYVHSFYSFKNPQTRNQKVPITSILFDSLFWQALGKACGWKTGCNVCLGKFNKIGECLNPKEHFTKGHLFPYHRHALRFHEINLTEGYDKAVLYLQGVTQ